MIFSVSSGIDPGPGYTLVRFNHIALVYIPRHDDSISRREVCRDGESIVLVHVVQVRYLALQVTTRGQSPS